MVTIAFTGGGTGGHIYPGLAIVESLKEKLAGQEHRILWIGSNAGMDRSIVEGAGLEFFGIPAGKLRRYFTLKTIPDVFKVAAGFFTARRILKKQKVNLLFSKGGFVFDLFGKIPVKYEKAIYQGTELIVQEMDGHKIKSVKIVAGTRD